MIRSSLLIRWSLITALLLTSSISAFATVPSAVPSGILVPMGGLFAKYFQNLASVTCPPGKAITNYVNALDLTYLTPQCSSLFWESDGAGIKYTWPITINGDLTTSAINGNAIENYVTVSKSPAMPLTENKLPKTIFVLGKNNVLWDSQIYDDGTSIGIGTMVPGIYKLFVNGNQKVENNLVIGDSVGIGTATPTAKLDVAGSTKTVTLQVTGGSPWAGKVLTSDVAGNAIWANNPALWAGTIICDGSNIWKYKLELWEFYVCKSIPPSTYGTSWSESNGNCNGSAPPSCNPGDTFISWPSCNQSRTTGGCGWISVNCNRYYRNYNTCQTPTLATWVLSTRWCKNPLATNFNPDAIVGDWSCTGLPIIPTDPSLGA